MSAPAKQGEPKYILHIGANKTGSSSIQRMLYDCRHVLEDHGWIYPDFHTLYGAHHRLAHSIGGSDAYLPKTWRDELQTLISSLPDRRFIFSSELFFRVVPARMTAAVFPPGQTRVILYMRDHLGYMMSWYAQAIQERNLTASFSDYLQIFSQPFSGYLDAWDEIYGTENVIVRPFARDKLIGGDTRRDFIETAGLPSLPEVALTAPESNPSISGNLLFFKKILNNFMSEAEAKSAPIPDEFGAYPEVAPSFSGRFRISEHEYKLVRRIFSEDLEALTRRRVDIDFKPFPQGGNLVGDFDTLRQDLRLIKDIALATDKRFVHYAERWIGWNDL